MSSLPNLKDLFTKNIDESEYSSLPTRVANSIFQRNSISNFVRPVMYADKKRRIFTCNDKNYGLSIELVARITQGQNVADLFTDILEDLPNDVNLQISMYGLENIENLLRDYELQHKVRNDPMINEIVDCFVDFYREKTKQSLCNSIESNLKTIRVIISVKSPNLKSLVKFSKSMEYKCNSNEFYPRRLQKKDLQDVYCELLNFYDDLRDIGEPQRNKFFNKQITKINQHTKVNDNNIQLGVIGDDGKFKGKYWKALAIENVSEQFHITDFAEKIGYVTGTKSQVNKNQFKDSFIISFNIKKATNAEVKGIGLNQTIIDKQIADTKDEDLKAKKAESREINKQIGNESNFFKTDIIVLVAGEDEEQLEQNVTDVRDFWKKGTYKAGQIKLERANGVHLPLFLSALPMGLNDEYWKLQDKPYYWSAEIASHFLPLESAWKGNGANILAISRRNTLIGIDLHKTDESKNFFSTGTSGAGKSVKFSNFIFNDYARAGRVFILDIGASYENLVLTLNGIFLQPNKENPISFNPLARIENEEQLSGKDGYRDFLTAWFYLIGGNKDPQTFLKEQNFIKGKLDEVIVDVWRDNYSKNIVTEPTHVRDRLKEIADETQDRRLMDFVVTLGKICKGGTHYEFYRGKPNWDIRKSDLVCLDFTKIQDDEDLRNSLIFVATFFFSEAVYKGDGSKSISFYIDEFHKHLGKNKHMDKEVDTAYRTYRKHNGLIGTGTQGFDDLVDVMSNKENPVGKVITTNSAWSFFGRQKEVAKNLLLKSSLFDFTHDEKDALENPTGVKYEYSEFMIVTPESYKIPIRFFFPYIFILLSEADVTKKAHIEKVANDNNITRFEAIKLIANNKDFTGSQKKAS